jgi:hypothetical protein
MKPFEFIHSGCIEQLTDDNWKILRSKLSLFKNWRSVNVTGLRCANDNIVFLMYLDDSGNFHQFNSLDLIHAYIAITDNLETNDLQHKIMDEFVDKQAPVMGINTKDLRFADCSVEFLKEGRKIKNYLCINIQERVVPE